MCSQPPNSSVPTIGTRYPTSTTGNHTVRRNSVYRSASYEPLMSVSVRRTRRPASRSASIVRAPSTVSASEDVICAYAALRSEEHTSELQSRGHLVCRLLLEKKKRTKDIREVLPKENNVIS